MPGHSRSKNGVASLAYVPGISLRWARCNSKRDGRDKPGHDGSKLAAVLVYRMHSMATKSSQALPLQEPGPLEGMAPVMSSRSTLWNDKACVYSWARQ